MRLRLGAFEFERPLATEVNQLKRASLATRQPSPKGPARSNQTAAVVTEGAADDRLPMIEILTVEERIQSLAMKQRWQQRVRQRLNAERMGAATAECREPQDSF